MLSPRNVFWITYGEESNYIAYRLVYPAFDLDVGFFCPEGLGFMQVPELEDAFRKWKENECNGTIIPIANCSTPLIDSTPEQLALPVEASLLRASQSKQAFFGPNNEQSTGSEFVSDNKNGL